MKSAKHVHRKLSLRRHTLVVLSRGELTSVIRGGVFDSVDGHCTLSNAIVRCAFDQALPAKRPG